jgi:hypothetical protein
MWKPIPGWEGWYEVSDRGQVRSVQRRVTLGNGFDRVYQSHHLRQATNRKGYKDVKLSRPSEVWTPKVHRLVLEAFVGPCPDGMECRHLNNDPADNRLENLAWGTKAENGADQSENGLKKGERQHTAKLSAFQVFMLRERPNYRGIIRDIAEEFGIHRLHAGRIRSGKYWAWL